MWRHNGESQGRQTRSLPTGGLNVKCMNEFILRVNGYQP
ncbi:hypothetical protein ATN83_3053 [Raoultella ornithinolytica]|nr:hypothetical protein ATN83_3053 [Raoultella ornithinolytica]KDV93789.1 hypothetical protein AB00_1933 [Raoultella ornithinolytica 2-156-04_S1_C1]KDX14019.1 hypothetical protein AB28_2122 [Raoultella ornithinolytica 2-156-04_S1_C2]